MGRAAPAAFLLVGLLEATLISRAHPVVQAPARQAAFVALTAAADLACRGLPWAAVALLTRRRAHGRSWRNATAAALATAGAVVVVVGNVPGRPAAAPQTPPPSRSHPSIVLVTIDTLRADHVSAYGHGPVTTTSMDAVARDGVLFEDAYSQAPLTAPSHASLLSGIIPPAHGSRYNAVRAVLTESAMAPSLRAAGYRTGAFVSSAVLTAAWSGLDKGFDVYDELFLPQAISQQLYLTTPARASLEAAGRKPPERRARAAVERAQAFLEESLAGDRPFFLWLHLYDPHIPYAPPRRFLHAADPGYQGSFEVDTRSVVELREGRLQVDARDLEHGRRAYAAEVAYVDHCLAPFLERLRTSPRPILVALTSDHGESLGEHGYRFFHGENLMRPSMQVPLILCGPGVPRGHRISALVRLIDVMPTLLELAGVAVPPRLDGRSLLPVLRGQEMAPAASYGEDGDRLYLAPATGAITLENKDVGLRSGRYSYVLRPSSGAEALYDVVDDPGELRNLAHDEATAPVRARLKAELATMTDLSSYGRATAPIDDEARRALEQLGYVEGPPPSTPP